MADVVARIEAYARAVVAGEIPAGKYQRLACVRHLRDLARQATPTFPYRLDATLAERICRFFSKLKHYKGEWAGHPIVLEGWQVFLLGSVAGWVREPDGIRRFRQAYVEVPRKNGKTLIGGGSADYFTFFDNEPGAEGYCAATKRDQAQIAFGDARQLVKASGLSSETRGAARVALLTRNMSREDLVQKLEPLGADSDSTDGLNVHFALIDEYHAHKSRALVDVIETAMGARRQPVILKITTAGDNPASPCGDEHDYACKLLDGVLTDETYFAFIAHADADDDWTAETTWAKANPNYGVSVKADDMRALCVKARGIPSAAATFKQKRLNLWVNATSPCLSVDGWRKGQTAWSPDEMAGESCWVGVDLASKIDLCALSLVFPPTDARKSWRLVQHIWTPADTLTERAHRDRAPYDVWVQQGWLKTTPGSRIDHDVIRQVLREAREKYHIELVGFDPWHADKLVEELVWEDGLPDGTILAVPQTFAGMTSACLRFQADVLAGEVDARGCPVTTWSVSNVVGSTDNKGNLMFAKGKSRGRIDPVIAPTIGMSLYLRQSVAVEPTYQMMLFGGKK